MEVGWFILGENQQHLGPYTFSELREHFSNGYLTHATLVWSQGRSQWQPLSSIPELVTQVVAYHQEAPSVSSSDINDEFEKYHKQISEVEEDGERPLTPLEGEEEFVDDDGTQYKWDRELGFLRIARLG